MKPRDFTEIKIIDTLMKKDRNCPVCVLVERSVEQLIDTILYELVNDPQIRADLREVGLCKRHTDKVQQYLQKHPELGLLGIAIIYEDMMDSHLKALNETTSLNHNCYLCNRETEIERMYITSFGKLFNDREGLDLFRKSKSILCIDHYCKLSSKMNPAYRNSLSEIEIAKLTSLKNDLSMFIKKHDYRNRESFKEEEASAYRIAGGILAKPVNLNARRSSRWKPWKLSQDA
ncbi:DUF6062 family protein [Pseudothermotoga sp. U03pept]|uniref:DUF6062 family protein n=1 Tax=Pseudothermotoga sp. U03pept TaxID=3447012 RepID=UPI003F072873